MTHLVKWYSDNSGKNGKRGILFMLFHFSEKLSLERTLPFDFPPEQPASPYKWEVIKVSRIFLFSAGSLCDQPCPYSHYCDEIQGGCRCKHESDIPLLCRLCEWRPVNSHTCKQQTHPQYNKPYTWLLAAQNSPPSLCFTKLFSSTGTYKFTSLYFESEAWWRN